MRKGFTLVELAIVLVIIGLIMGMAIKGKSLIDVAKMNKELGKMNRISTAFATYYAKNNRMPVAEPNSGTGFYYRRDALKDYISEQDLKTDLKTSFYSFFPCALTNGKYWWGYNNDQACFTATSATSAQNTTYYLTSSSNFSRKTSCYIEAMLDDSDYSTGNGRILDTQSLPTGVLYDDCYSEKGTQGYAYRIF